MVPAQCRMARAALQLGIRELAEAAKVTSNTITRFERGEPLMDRTLEVIQRALEAAGVEFTNGKRPGVRLRSGTVGEPLAPKEIKVGDRVRYRSDRPVPGDPGAIGTAVDGGVPQSATQVYVQFQDEAAPVFVDRGMLEIVPPAPISDEAAIGDDPESRGDPYTGSAK